MGAPLLRTDAEATGREFELDAEVDLAIEAAFSALAAPEPSAPAVSGGSGRPLPVAPPPARRGPSPPWAGDDASDDRVGALVSSAARVSPEDRVSSVAERFFQDAALEAVALVDGDRPVGLLTRSRLLLTLAKSFGQELWAKKPVSRVADLSALVLEEDASLEDAISRALARSAEAVYDEVIVVDHVGRYTGLLQVRELVLQQGVALARVAADHAAAEARTRDLERLEQLRAQFLAHSTHELRSPVNAIVSLAEVLRRTAEKGDHAKVRDHVALLQRTATALRGTVNNILDLSRLEAGRTDLAVQPVELAPLLEELAQTTRLLVGEKPVEVRALAPAGLVVKTDRQKLRQIVVNLASNAAKFTERGRIELAAASTEGGARLLVRDTGPGIREADLSRLFTPFGQLEDALTKAHEGTGLGLVITRSLATLLGGRIEVESRFGAGSTFTLHLPSQSPGSPTP